MSVDTICYFKHRGFLFPLNVKFYLLFTFQSKADQFVVFVQQNIQMNIVLMNIQQACRSSPVLSLASPHSFIHRKFSNEGAILCHDQTCSTIGYYRLKSKYSNPVCNFLSAVRPIIIQEKFVRTFLTAVSLYFAVFNSVHSCGKFLLSIPNKRIIIIRLTFWRRIFFQILAHPVFKM